MYHTHHIGYCTICTHIARVFNDGEDDDGVKPAVPAHCHHSDGSEDDDDYGGDDGHDHFMIVSDKDDVDVQTCSL